ncbi:hypothetical protein GWK47_042101 [Chionoecetes opilio]|uniref:Uncharacterized protein n=1 Tax=Chionoecetes opilio TaxID=41210 RepID=A0A8J4YAK2_CHIOP|nr:hypothetical protein GWK47_042101 [Chionoecetes opilio]
MKPLLATVHVASVSLSETMVVCVRPLTSVLQAVRSLVVRQCLAYKNTVVIPHPPDSPDPTSCDIFLFSKLTFWLKGCCFDTIEEIQEESREVLKTVMPEDFQGAWNN